MTQEEFAAAESGMARSCGGHCMTMGTASTMACMAEALGMQLPGSAAWPAADSRRYVDGAVRRASGSSRWSGKTCARRRS